MFCEGKTTLAVRTATTAVMVQCQVLGTASRTFLVLTRLILHSYPHFIDNQTEAQVVSNLLGGHTVSR